MSSNSAKKRVTFADAFEGLSLTEVIPSTDDDDDVSADLLEHLHVDGGSSHRGWTVTFPQPMDDGCSLQDLLRVQRVALERVTIESDINGSPELCGKVLVKDYCEGKVTVRVSGDSWRSFQDITAMLVSSNKLPYSQYLSLIATYVFRFPLCGPWDRIEFCIRYANVSDVFWDTNRGNSYLIIRV